MRWVERDTGVIIGDYRCEQPGVAEESVTPLEYVISTEIPGGVNAATLDAEIRASAITLRRSAAVLRGAR